MHVVANAAVSADGKISTRERGRFAISGPEDFDRVDRLRAAADAVMVGVGTVLADDPHLTLDEEDRRVERLRNGRPSDPARVVADSTARTPPDARILDDAATTYLLVTGAAPAERVERLERADAVVVTAGDGDRVDLQTGLDALAARGVDRLLVEGGGELLFSLFAAGLVDEFTLYVGSLVVGGREAPTVVDGDGFVDDVVDLRLEGVERLDDGVVLSYGV